MDYQSPLVKAIVEVKFVEAEGILTGERVDLNRRDHSGRCPLDYCFVGLAKSDYSELQEDKKYTGVCGRARLLMDYGANVNLQDRFGWTVCHQCASIGHMPLLQLFVRRGADVTITNTSGQSALDIAVIRGHAPVVRYLEMQSGSLHSACRMVIRESIKGCPANRLNGLPLPASLKLFINYNVPYPGWATPSIVARPWTEEEIVSGKVTKEEVQGFIEEHASAEFLAERKVSNVSDLAELVEALYFWEAFKTINYDEPVAPPPRYSMDPDNPKKRLSCDRLHTTYID